MDLEQEFWNLTQKSSYFLPFSSFHACFSVSAASLLALCNGKQGGQLIAHLSLCLWLGFWLNFGFRLCLALGLCLWLWL